MNLHEYQAKEIFVKYGLLCPKGEIATTPEGVAQIAKIFDGEVVLKPQLSSKSRGKAGKIRFANTPESAYLEALQLFSESNGAEKIELLLVEENIPIDKELYVAVTIDYTIRQPVLLVSTNGGINIEDVATMTPSQILKIPVDILNGPSVDAWTTIEVQTGSDVVKFLQVMYRIFREYDAKTVEINPLVRSTGGDYLALDGVLEIDDDSLFRHTNFININNQISRGESISDEALRNNWSYIDLPGDIGILSSGAGLTMAILDLIYEMGGKPANFLDTAKMDAEGIYRAFDLLSRAKVFSVLLVNIFAGLNRCDSLATGIKKYLTEHPMNIPVVVRMVGNFEDEGHRILRDVGITPFLNLEDAILHVVEISKNSQK